MRLLPVFFLAAFLSAIHSIGSYSLTSPDGFIIDREDLDDLPSSGYYGHLLEQWLLPVVSANVDTGGFSSLEEQLESFHGESIFWQRHFLNNQDMTDPWHAGEPLLQIPYNHLDSFALKSLFNIDKGLYWNTFSPESFSETERNSLVRLSAPATIGGPSLIPENVMDRQPAQNWGAPEETRSFELPSAEMNTRFLLPSSFPAVITFDSLVQNRSFVLPEEDTSFGYRENFAMNIDTPTPIFFAGESQQRDKYGIENVRESDIEQKRAALLIQGTAGKAGVLSAGFSHESKTSAEDEFMEDWSEIANQGPLSLPGEVTTWYIGHSKEFEDVLWDYDCSVASRYEGVVRKQDDLTIARNLYGFSDSADIVSGAEEMNAHLLRTRPKCSNTISSNRLSFTYNAGFLSEGIVAANNPTLSRLSPEADIRTSIKTSSNKRLIFYLGHSGVPLQLNLTQYYHNGTGTTERYSWSDTNANGVVEESELLTAQSRSGGAVTTLDPDLKPTMREELTIAFEKYKGPWQWNVNLTGKIYRNLYTLSYDTPAEYSTSSVDTEDGKETIYIRTDDYIGSERYTLTNQENVASYLHLEIQIMRTSFAKYWFVNYAIAHYLALGHPIQGNGPWYNDIGALSWNSADANAQTNTYAHTDYDRGYVSNLLFGRRGKHLVWTNALRYRDGEPYGAMTLVSGLPQGTTLIHTKNRANPILGTPRQTFALTWDMRFQYHRDRWTTGLDIYNLLNSQTEIWENSYESNSTRDPLEATSERSIRVFAGMRF